MVGGVADWLAPSFLHRHEASPISTLRVRGTLGRNAFPIHAVGVSWALGVVYAPLPADLEVHAVAVLQAKFTLILAGASAISTKDIPVAVNTSVIPVWAIRHSPVAVLVSTIGVCPINMAVGPGGVLVAKYGAAGRLAEASLGAALSFCTQVGHSAGCVANRVAHWLTDEGVRVASHVSCTAVSSYGTGF